MAIGVLADTNVLFSKTLRDWLFLLRNASGGNMFAVYSTEDIIAEAVYRWRRAHPQAAGGPAAVASGAAVLLTDDGGFAELTDRQRAALPYDVYTPDELFVLIDDSAPGVVRQATTVQWKHWQARPESRSLPDQLIAAGCPTFAERVRHHLAD